ncbi:MAG: hypothetical protein LBL45_04525 [Treponema sp.]|jgi:hypothetical protein|nr:hypothetical protein [Treponema sp.]
MLLLRKWTVIEAANDFLKNIFLVSLLAALPDYTFLPHKLSIQVFQDERLLK